MLRLCYHKLLNIFIKNGDNTYVAALDATKAFDWFHLIDPDFSR